MRAIPARFSTVGLAIAVLLLFGLGIVSQRNGRQQAETASLVAHTHEVINNVHRMLAGLDAAESSVRGFAITRNERLLRDFDFDVTEAERAIGETRTLTEDNAEQQARLDRLEPLVARRLLLLREKREHLREGGAQFRHTRGHRPYGGNSRTNGRDDPNRTTASRGPRARG